MVRSNEIELDIFARVDEEAAAPPPSTALRTLMTWAFRIQAVECLRRWVASPARLFFSGKSEKFLSFVRISDDTFQGLAR